MGGFPDSMIQTLEYSDVITISSGGSSFAAYAMRGNSVYDPDYTSTGHSALYYDDLMKIYSKYKVTSATLNVHFLAESNAFIYIVPLTDLIPANADTPTRWELARARCVPVGAAYIQPSRSFKATYTSQAIFGINHQQMMDDSYSGTITTNPDQIWYINFLAISSNLGGLTSLNAAVKISYTTIFYDRIAPTPSFSLSKPIDLEPQPTRAREVPGLPVTGVRSSDQRTQSAKCKLTSGKPG